MSENNDIIRITFDDIDEANQLSLACPICAGPVENNVTEVELSPVVCGDCDTLYHRVCWNNNGGKCAVLGCNCKQCRPYGVTAEVMTITSRDLPSDAEVKRRNQELKRMEKVRARQAARQQPSQSGSRVASPPTSVPPQPQGFWSQLFSRILRAFGG